MTIALTSPVTGGAQTGFTAPTFTAATDSAPDTNGKQYSVTALGGTQAGVRPHTVSDPFTILFVRPKNPKVLPSPNPITGKYPAVPMNQHMIKVWKGVNYAASQAPVVASFQLTMNIPAGSDSYDSANIRAALSLLSGALSQQSAGQGDTLINGIL